MGVRRETMMCRLLATTALAVLVTTCSPTDPAVEGGSTTTTAITSTTAASTTSSAAPTTSTSSAEPAEPPGSLLVFGDWGSGTLPQGAVAGAMARFAEENEVHAILTTGDNFYSDDADFLMHPMQWAVEAGIPYWITWGNHDIVSENRIEAVDEAFGDPPRWARYEWGGIDVVVLDSNQIDSAEQGEFLVETLADSSDPTIVVFHHPVFSCSIDRERPPVLETWVPLFDDDVFLVLSGHDHVYERFESDEVTYIVSGGGGRPLNEVVECPPGHPQLMVGEALHHFLVLEQVDGLEITAIDVNGATIDEVELAALP